MSVEEIINAEERGGTEKVNREGSKPRPSSFCPAALPGETADFYFIYKKAALELEGRFRASGRGKKIPGKLTVPEVHKTFGTPRLIFDLDLPVSR